MGILILLLLVILLELIYSRLFAAKLILLFPIMCTQANSVSFDVLELFSSFFEVPHQIPGSIGRASTFEALDLDQFSRGFSQAAVRT